MSLVISEEDYGTEKEINDILKNFTDHVLISFYSFIVRKYIYFPAFITAFQDNFKSNWTTQEIYGRMDPISTFKNTTRTINFSFDIPSLDIVEAAKNMARIDLLIQGLYPTYTADSVINSPPLYKIKIATLIDDGTGRPLLGYLDGFNFKPKIDSGFFIVKRQELIQKANTSRGSNKFLMNIVDKLDEQNPYITIPKLIQADIVFNVIHDVPLGRDPSKKPRSILTAPSKSGEAKTYPTYIFPHGFYDKFTNFSNENDRNVFQLLATEDARKRK